MADTTKVVSFHLFHLDKALKELDDNIDTIEQGFETLHDLGRRDLIHNFAAQYTELLRKRDKFKTYKKEVERWTPGQPFPQPTQ